MNLIIIFKADSRVGINETHYQIPCPFDSDADDETKTLFLVSMTDVYKDYCETAMSVFYDTDMPNTAIPFEAEINELFKYVFFEEWMDDKDWLLFLNELELETGVTVKSLSEKIQEGIAQGLTVKQQIEYLKKELKKAYANR